MSPKNDKTEQRPIKVEGIWGKIPPQEILDKN